MLRIFSLITISLLFSSVVIYSQDDDLLSLLGEEEHIDYTTASFKTSRVINLHSLENTAPGVMDFKISHRFGTINSGIQNLFGLDNASIRLGFEFGLTPHLMAGFGRSSLEKNFDGFFKLKLLRQSGGKRNMPISVLLFGSTVIKTATFQGNPDANFFSNRLFYTSQLIIGRKFSEGFTLQLSPSYVHRNLVTTAQERNDIFALGIGLRQKLNKRITINAEYIYVPADQLPAGLNNSLSIGFDIETGGHVFQLQLTNSISMVEKGFIAENTASWSNMGIHFGFNIARVFTLWQPKKM